jgi:chaperonin GroEL (HSP60 family)
MAQAIDAEVPSTAGKRALAMEAYARALRQLPTIIADNGGYDSSELVTQVRAGTLLNASCAWHTTASDTCCCQSTHSFGSAHNGYASRLSSCVAKRFL